MKPVYISLNTLNSIKNTLCNYSAECGGVIASDSNGHIVDFYFDHEAGVGKKSYHPSSSTINQIVNEKWLPGGLQFSGVVHSHPSGTRHYPSKVDLITAEKILSKNTGSDSILLMITQNSKIKVWEMKSNQSLRECKLYVNSVNQFKS